MVIDVHTHILYDIDDGAKDISDSLKLIKMEIDNDVDTVVLTPHFDPYTDSIDVFVQKCREHYHVLLEYVSNENINLILGSETFYSSLLLYYGTLNSLCIEGTRYLLLEFPVNLKFNQAFFTELEKLILKFDIVPILAHTERYTYVKKHIKIIERFKELGCIIQINAEYILNNFDNKFVKQLFRYNYIDMIASDCHDSEKKVPNLKETISLINERYDGYYDKILLNKYKIK